MNKRTTGTKIFSQLVKYSWLISHREEISQLAAD